MTVTEKKFFSLFWQDPLCQKIFSINKNQLLEGEVDLIFTRQKFPAQRLVLTNSKERKSENQIAKRAENENIELVHNFQSAVQKYFDEDKLEAYLKKRFGKTIKKLETDLNSTGSGFRLITKIIGSLKDEQNLFELLADYHLLPEGIKNKEELLSYVESEFKTHFQEFIKRENLADLAITIDLLSIYYNHKIKKNLVGATKHFTDILYDNESFQDRLELFDTLYEIGAINGGKLKSYYECVSCPPNTLNGILTVNIKPSNLKLKCPCCDKELFYIVPYEIERNIYDKIVDQDGILFFALQYLLSQNNYIYQINQKFPPDIELDICLFNDEKLMTEIIEVKMFKTDRHDDTQFSNLGKTVSQLKNIIDKLFTIHPGYKSIKKSIITNISSADIYKKARKEFSSDLREYNIDLYTIAEFSRRIQNI